MDIAWNICWFAALVIYLFFFTVALVQEEDDKTDLHCNELLPSDCDSPTSPPPPAAQKDGAGSGAGH